MLDTAAVVLLNEVPTWVSCSIPHGNGVGDSVTHAPQRCLSISWSEDTSLAQEYAENRVDHTVVQPEWH